jgi:3-oxoadipate enol-lactonase
MTTERWIDVPGGRLYSVADGQGRPIVLVHAGIADLRAWDPMIPGLVAAGFTAIRYDVRAYGRSTTQDVPFSNRADLMAVLDAWGFGRAALVGNSRGGQIAFDTAIEFPDRVVAVVGVGAGLGGLDVDVAPEEVAIFEEGERLESAVPRDADAIADFDVRIWVDGPGQSPDRVAPAIREAVRTMDRPLYLPGRIEGQPIVLTPPAAARMAELRCPVLAVAGTLDIPEVAETARHLEAHAPNARAVFLPDVAHMIGMEVPDKLNVLIADFLRPLGTWS